MASETQKTWMLSPKCHSAVARKVSTEANSMLAAALCKGMLSLLIEEPGTKPDIVSNLSWISDQTEKIL